MNFYVKRTVAMLMINIYIAQNTYKNDLMRFTYKTLKRLTILLTIT